MALDPQALLGAVAQGREQPQGSNSQDLLGVISQPRSKPLDLFDSPPRKPMKSEEPKPSTSFLDPHEDWADYLAEVGNTGMKAHPMAASALWKAMQEAESQGVNVGITSSWRDPEHQAELFAKYGSGRASLPGHSSHEGGIAFDLHGDLEKFRPIAKKYGIENPWDAASTPHEAHHFVYKGKFEDAMEAEYAVSEKKLPVLGRAKDPTVLKSWAETIAAQEGIDRPDLFRALIRQESAWNSKAVSSAKAQGLGQVIPSTWEYIRKKHPEFKDVTWDQYKKSERIQLKASAFYLKEQLETFKNWPQALAAYNAGPGNVQNGQAAHFRETKNYVANILGTDEETASQWIQHGNNLPFEETPEGRRPKPSVGGGGGDAGGTGKAKGGGESMPEDLWYQPDAIPERSRRRERSMLEAAGDTFILPFINTFLKNPITAEEQAKGGYSIWEEMLNNPKDEAELVGDHMALLGKKFASGFSFGLSNYLPFVGMDKDDKSMDKWITDNSGMIGTIAHEAPTFLGMLAMLRLTGGSGAAGEAAGATRLQKLGLAGETTMGLGRVNNFLSSFLTNPAMAGTRAAKWLLGKESPEIIRWAVVGGAESFNRNFANSWFNEGKPMKEAFATAMSAGMFDAMLYGVGVPIGSAVGYLGTQVVRNAPGPAAGAAAGYALGGAPGAFTGAIIGGGKQTMSKIAPDMTKQVSAKVSSMWEKSLAGRSFSNLATKQKEAMVGQMMKYMDAFDDPKNSEAVKKFVATFLGRNRDHQQMMALKQSSRSIGEQMIDTDLGLRETVDTMTKMRAAGEESAKRVAQSAKAMKAYESQSGNRINQFMSLRKDLTEAQQQKQALAQAGQDTVSADKAIADASKSLKKFEDDVTTAGTPDAAAFMRWRTAFQAHGMQNAQHKQLVSVLERGLPELEEFANAQQLTREQLKKTSERLQNKPVREEELYNRTMDGDIDTPQALEVMDSVLTDEALSAMAVLPEETKKVVNRTIQEVSKARGSGIDVVESSVDNIAKEIDRFYGDSKPYFKEELSKLQKRISDAKKGEGPMPSMEEITELMTNAQKVEKKIPKPDEGPIQNAIASNPKSDYKFNEEEFRFALMAARTGDRSIIGEMQNIARQWSSSDVRNMTTEFEQKVSDDFAHRVAHMDEARHMANEFKTPDDHYAATADIVRHLDGRLQNAHMLADVTLTKIGKALDELDPKSFPTRRDGTSRTGDDMLTEFVDKLYESTESGDWRTLAKYLGENQNTMGKVAEPLLAVVKDISRLKSSDNVYGFMFKNLNVMHRFPRRLRWLRETDNAGDARGVGVQKAATIQGLKSPPGKNAVALRGIAASAENKLTNQWGFGDWEDFVFNYKSHEARLRKAQQANPDVSMEEIDGVFNHVLLGGAGRSPKESLRDYIFSAYQADSLRHMFHVFSALEGPGGTGMITTALKARGLMGKMRLRKPVAGPDGKMLAKGSYSDMPYVSLRELMPVSQEFRAFGQAAGDAGEDMMVHPEVAAFVKDFMVETDYVSTSNGLVSAFNAVRQATLMGSPLPYLFAQFSNMTLLGGLNVGRTIGMYRQGKMASEMRPEIVADFIRHGGQQKRFKTEFELVDDMIKSHPSIFKAANRDRQAVAGGAGDAVAEGIETTMDPKKRSRNVTTEGQNVPGGAGEVMHEAFRRMRDVDESLMEPMMFKAIKDGQIGAWMYRTQQLWKTESAKLMSPAGGGLSKEHAMSVVKKLAADQVNQASGALPRWWVKDSTRRNYFNLLLTPQWTGARISAMEGALDGVLQKVFGSGTKGSTRRSRFAHVPPELRNRIKGDYKKFMLGGITASLAFANVMSYLLNGHSTFRNRRGREWDIRVGDDTYLSNPIFTFHKQMAKMFLAPFTSSVGRDQGGGPQGFTKGIMNKEDWRIPDLSISARSILNLAGPGPQGLMETAVGKTNIMGGGRPEELRGLDSRFRHALYNTLPVEEFAGVEYNPSYVGDPDSTLSRAFSAPKMKKSSWWGRQTGIFDSNSSIVREAYADESSDLEYNNRILRQGVEHSLIQYQRTKDPKYLKEASEKAFNKGIKVSNKTLARQMGLQDGRLRMSSKQYANAVNRILNPHWYQAKSAPTKFRESSYEAYAQTGREHIAPGERGLGREILEHLHSLDVR